MSDIRAKCDEIRNSIPPGVTLVAATKGRTVEEILEAAESGVEIAGENYVQEAVRKYSEIGDGVKWHMIGHLQRNKVRDVLRVFDCIQSVDSLRLAKEIDRQCERTGKVMQVLLEINIAGEENKYGISPEELPNMLQQMAVLPNLQVNGLMTMEPYFDDPEDSRPYFKRMKRLFDEARSYDIPNAEIGILSMGMSNSYQVAIEEGSNMVRVGTRLFGPRPH
ncbi:YggS family pyridoxal phosphate-dependent enzyme [Candidatus Poribacteria bacterium]